LRRDKSSVIAKHHRHIADVTESVQWLSRYILLIVRLDAAQIKCFRTLALELA